MKRWYVLQVFTGFEEIVKTDIEKRFEEQELDDLLGEVLVPSGEVASFFSEASPRKEKIFPGYLLIQMDLTGDTFSLISATPRVTRFLGGESPAALSQKEVDRIFAQMSGELEVLSEKTPFIEGSEVHIASGPFSGFIGIVEKVDEDREKLTVMVSIFGRMTPVELGFDQVKR